MSDRTIGPEDDFLSTYLGKHYRKAKTLMARARAVGVSLDDLAEWAREDFEKLEFKITIREQEKMSGNFMSNHR